MMKCFVYNILLLVLVVSAKPLYASTLDEYINSTYVNKFNEEIADFIGEMKLLTDGRHYFVHSNHTANDYRSPSHKRITFNLFYGDKKYLYQITTSGSAGLSFKSNNFNLEGEILFGMFILKCNGKVTSLKEIIDQEEKDIFFQNVTFVPVFPERKQWFYYKQDENYVFIDTYRDNLVDGEVRVFIGTPGKMKQYNVRKILSYECDKNPTFVLEGRKGITPPENVYGVLKPHNINGKLLGIESNINEVKGLTKPDIILPCPEHTMVIESSVEKAHEKQQKYKHKNSNMSKTDNSLVPSSNTSFVQKSHPSQSAKITPGCTPLPKSGKNELNNNAVIINPGLKLKVNDGYSSRPHKYCEEKDN